MTRRERSRSLNRLFSSSFWEWPLSLRVTRDAPRLSPLPFPAIGPPCSAETVLPSHFSVSPANLCTRAVQGRRQCARVERESSIPTTSRSLPTFSGGGSWAEPLLETAHSRIPSEGVQFGASPSCFRPPPLVPGFFWFRTRVILRTNGPTRPIPRLPMRGMVPTFLHPEPPLLSSASGLAPFPWGLMLGVTPAPS
jgi:hypothetical protein